jgi:YhcH/YjgK/YiaL family protein
MIHDTLQHSAQYESIHHRFKKAFDFLKTTDFSTLNVGKISIDGENIFATIALSKGIKASESKVETHKKHIDIQMPISTTETMGWISKENLKSIGTEYNEEKDIVFFDDKATNYVSVKPMEFVVFFPEDGHQPCIADTEIKKVIVKVLI